MITGFIRKFNFFLCVITWMVISKNECMHLIIKFNRDTQVNITSSDGVAKEVKILGIDSFGYLEVQSADGKIFSVQPDGNSFDILKGLIAPSA